MYKFTDLDLGIALCHISLASQHFDLPFGFVVESDVPKEPKGYKYIGTVV